MSSKQGASLKKEQQNSVTPEPGKDAKLRDEAKRAREDVEKGFSSFTEYIENIKRAHAEMCEKQNLLIEAQQQEIAQLQARLKEFRQKLENQNGQISQLKGDVTAAKRSPPLAIDLGNTTCSMSYFEDDKIQRVFDDRGQTSFSTSMRNTPKGSKTVDDPFELGVVPNTLSDITCLTGCIGKTYEEIRTLENKGHLLLPCRYHPSSDGGVLFAFSSKTDENIYSATALTAILLSKLKKMASEHLNQRTLTDVILVVPSTLNGAQRRALSNAAHAAKFKKIYILVESMAAFLLYKHLSVVDGSRPKSIVLVISMGAFHLEVSLFINGQMEKSASDCIGGSYIDQAIASIYLARSPTDMRSEAVKITEECCKLKERLSAGINKAQFTMGGKANPITFALTSEDFERWIMSKVYEKLEQLLYSVFHKVSVNPEEIVLCGKSTLIPSFQKYIGRRYPGVSICRRLGSPEAISDGASLYLTMSETLRFPLNINVELQMMGTTTRGQPESSHFPLSYCFSLNDTTVIPISTKSLRGKFLSNILLKEDSSMLGYISLTHYEIRDKLAIEFTLDDKGFLVNASVVGATPATTFTSTFDESKDKNDKAAAARVLAAYDAEVEERKLHSSLFNQIDSLIAAVKAGAKASSRPDVVLQKTSEWQQRLQYLSESPSNMLVKLKEEIERWQQK